MPAEISAVNINVEIARITEAFRELFNVSSVRWLPPSKSMSVRATALSSGPTYPKSSGARIPNRGPTSIPIIIRGSTSGIRVRSKSAVKKWAAKMIRPTENKKIVSIKF